MDSKSVIKLVTLSLLFLICAQSSFAMAVKVDEQATEKAFEEARSVLFSIREQDIIQYGEIMRLVETHKALDTSIPEGLKTVREEHEGYFTKRLDLCARLSFVKKGEIDRSLDFIETFHGTQLVPYRSLLAIFKVVLAKRKDKTSFKSMFERAKILLAKAREQSNRQAYHEQLLLNHPKDEDRLVFEAKVALLRRKLLADGANVASIEPFIDELAPHWKGDSLFCVLEANLHFVKARQANKEAKSQLLRKSFASFVEAIRRGQRDENAVPGLYAACADDIAKDYNQLVHYFPYPTYMPNFRELAHDVVNRSKEFIKYVPDKEQRIRVYGMLSNIYAYWPSKAGDKIIDFIECSSYSRLAGRSEAWTE